MKQKKLNWVLVCCLMVLAACSTDDTPITPEPERQHTEAVSELMRLMDGNPEVKALLEKSIAKAAEVNPDRWYNPAQTLTEFYDFVDWNVRQLPWDVTRWDTSSLAEATSSCCFRKAPTLKSSTTAATC